MSNERIDLTQLENQYKKRIEHNSFHAPDADKEDDLFVISDLIAELKRCYEMIDKMQEMTDKMQESIVKNRGDCWDCDMPIDSCDARTCERQMLEDIELGTASY